jgi:hypothetical protein
MSKQVKKDNMISKILICLLIVNKCRLFPLKLNKEKGSSKIKIRRLLNRSKLEKLFEYWLPIPFEKKREPTRSDCIND